MRTSCIQHPTAEPLIIVRTWQMVATSGNKAGAALLSFFEYWHNHRLEAVEKALKANEVAEMHGDKGTHSTSLLQFHSTADLEKGLLLFKADAIREGIKILEKMGFVSIHSNPNPRYKFDKTKYFLFHPDQVNEWIMNYKNGFNKPVESCEENPSRALEKPLRSRENPSALYIEITSDITQEHTYPEPGQNLTPFAEYLAPAVCPSKLPLTADSNDRFLGFRVEPETANNQQPPETINPSGSDLVDRNSAELIVFPEPTPIPPPPSLPDGGKFGALLDRFKAAKKTPAPLPAEVDRGRLKALADVQAERYAEGMEDPDGGLPGVGKSAQEGTLELFVVSLADELDKGTLLELIGEVNEPLPGQAPRLLVERLWDTYRQWRPNCWQAPATLEKSRSITTDVANLWRQMADPRKSTAENMADIELRFRATLFYFHCHPWYSGQEFKSKHLGYLLRCKRGETATIDKYADCWETTPAADKATAQQTINKLLQAREHAINS